MSPLQDQANQPLTLDTVTWLRNLLTRYATQDVPTNHGDASRLKIITLIEIISAIEQAGLPLGSSTTIYLYQQWIATQSADSAHLYLAWFNLGVACSEAQAHPNAILAYQNVIALRPDFYSAAINLGSELEAIGQTDAALQPCRRGRDHFSRTGLE